MPVPVFIPSYVRHGTLSCLISTEDKADARIIVDRLTAASLPSYRWFLTRVTVAGENVLALAYAGSGAALAHDLKSIVETLDAAGRFIED